MTCYPRFYLGKRVARENLRMRSPGWAKELLFEFSSLLLASKLQLNRSLIALKCYRNPFIMA